MNPKFTPGPVFFLAPAVLFFQTSDFHPVWLTNRRQKTAEKRRLSLDADMPDAGPETGDQGPDSPAPAPENPDAPDATPEPSGADADPIDVEMPEGESLAA